MTLRETHIALLLLLKMSIQFDGLLIKMVIFHSSVSLPEGMKEGWVGGRNLG